MTIMMPIGSIEIEKNEVIDIKMIKDRQIVI